VEPESRLEHTNGSRETAASVSRETTAGTQGAHSAGADASRETAAHAPSPAAPLAEEREAVKLPVHSTRGAAPGLRGCWAVNKQGDPCAAARRADGDYCNAHSGLGVAENPAKWARVGSAVAVENRRRRAMLRMELGIPRVNSPRGELKARAYVEREAVAARVVSAVLDPSVPSAQAARLGLELINTVDPPLQASVTAEIPTDPEGVNQLGLAELLALQEKLNPSPALELEAGQEGTATQ
jgi:hypothetical protein